MAKSVLSDNPYCYVCGALYTEGHHILFGHGNRKLSDEYGYTIRLCHEHHRGNSGAHFDRELDVHLKQMAQKHFESVHGSREDFIRARPSIHISAIQIPPLASFWWTFAWNTCRRSRISIFFISGSQTRRIISASAKIA